MSYLIHVFTFDGVNIVLDVHSNAVHIIDEATRQIIIDYEALSETDLLNKYSVVFGSQEVEEILAEIKELIDTGLLFSPDPLPKGYEPSDKQEVKALCLNLSHDCNLRCKYCFAGQGDFGGHRELMSEQVGKKALDFLLVSSGARRHVEVDFFGGEPLMNKDVLKKLVFYGQKKAAEAGKEIKFTLTTNALLLDEEMNRFIREHNLAVVLSADGRPQVHDLMRITPAGSGSYTQVLSRIKSFTSLANTWEYVIRGTFTHYNCDFSEDVQFLAEQGFSRISVEPVVATPEHDYAFQEQDVAVLLAEYDKLTRYLLAKRKQGQAVDFFHFNIDIDGGPCLSKRLTGCSAGLEYLAVAPDGSLYPCHQFVGQDDFKVGNVLAGFSGAQVTAQFRAAHIYTKSTCRECWAKFHCSGGCHANAYNFNGDLLKPYHLGCLLTRKRLECALYLKHANNG